MSTEYYESETTGHLEAPRNRRYRSFYRDYAWFVPSRSDGCESIEYDEVLFRGIVYHDDGESVRMIVRQSSDVVRHGNDRLSSKELKSFLVATTDGRDTVEWEICSGRYDYQGRLDGVRQKYDAANENLRLQLKQDGTFAGLTINFQSRHGVFTSQDGVGWLVANESLGEELRCASDPFMKATQAVTELGMRQLVRDCESS